MDNTSRSARCRHRAPRARGLSLVELLVATAITLIGLLVITQVFAVYEGWKRTTTGVAQTQESGLLGAFAIEQDLRNAGFGLLGLDCAKIGAYNAAATPSTDLEFAATALTIASNTPIEGNDSISVLYSSSPFANVRVKLQRPMTSSASPIYVDNGQGFSVGDMLLLAQGSNPCSILQVSATPGVEGENVTSSGSSWRLLHASTVAWNPPDGKELFPAGGYVAGARVINLGHLVDHRFYVQDNILRMAERSPVDGSVSTYDLAHGIMGLRAQCLPDGCANQPKAIRFGLIVRSGNREKEVIRQAEVSVVGASASIAYWPGDEAPTLVLDDEMRHYRYRVFHTVVPLKNAIWNP